MARAKAATADEKRKRAADRRLGKAYGIDTEERERRRKEQNYRCGCCGGPDDAYGPPNVDHFHFKIRAFRNVHPASLSQGLKWHAQTYDERGFVIYVRQGETKAKAIADVKKATLPWSVRGILCFKCNKGLGYVARFFGAESNPPILRKIEVYLGKRLA